MRVFGGFIFMNGAAAVNCGPGMATGIDANGGVDLSNINICYPTSDAAFIMSCNNATSNAAEMMIAIEKNFFETAELIFTNIWAAPLPPFFLNLKF